MNSPPPPHLQDLLFWEEMNRQLDRGEDANFQEIYTRLSPFLRAIARKYLRDQDQADSAVQELWREVLETRHWMAYRGEASLRTFLTQALLHRLYDRIRRARRRPTVPLEDFGGAGSGPSPAGPGGWLADARPGPLEEALARRRQGFVAEALLQLSSRSPEDAFLIQRRLEGAGFEELAVESLRSRGLPADAAAVKREKNRLRQRFTRDFRAYLGQALAARGLRSEDFLE